MVFPGIVRSALGVPLRSALGVMQRGAVSGPPPPSELFTCVYTWTISKGSGLLTATVAVPVSNTSCACSQEPGWDSGPDSRRIQDIRYVGASQTLGMGWELPPHPSMRIVGQTSGIVLTIPVHCANKCPGWPLNNFNNYSHIPGASDSANGYPIVDQSSTNLGDVPPSNGIIQALYRVEEHGTTAPWENEAVEVSITFDETTYPDRGPYNIVSMRDHRFRNETVLRFDRECRFATEAAVFLENAGSYSGMHEARESGDDFRHDLFDLTIKTPFTTDQAPATMTRIADQAWDCWHNLTQPSPPKPPLPSPP